MSSATFYHWKKVYDAHGEVGFSETKSPEDKRYKNLEVENRMLKKLFVDKDLALEAQKELLKKSLARTIQVDATLKDLVNRLAMQFKVSKLQVMKHVGLSPSVYYYQEKPGRKGCLPSRHTYHKERGNINNKYVVKQIENILSEPLQDYWGYHNITAELRDLGYRINHKKVYRLMKEEKLLKPSARLRPEKVTRKFVRFRKVITERPLECVEMDIKCVWIPERGKQAYLLTLLDVHTRKVLAYDLA